MDHAKHSEFQLLKLNTPCQVRATPVPFVAHCIGLKSGKNILTIRTSPVQSIFSGQPCESPSRLPTGGVTAFNKFPAAWDFSRTVIWIHLQFKERPIASSPSEASAPGTLRGQGLRDRLESLTTEISAVEAHLNWLRSERRSTKADLKRLKYPVLSTLPLEITTEIFGHCYSPTTISMEEPDPNLAPLAYGSDPSDFSDLIFDTIFAHGHHLEKLDIGFPPESLVQLFDSFSDFAALPSLKTLHVRNAEYDVVPSPSYSFKALRNARH
ncbi:hypothetical protein C8R44DRAFT_878632 [Mycena epipterygia]|nr:hypothetical protein C8R44DRAFT_878632 [Mycena epipterygia]